MYVVVALRATEHSVSFLLTASYIDQADIKHMGEVNEECYKILAELPVPTCYRNGFAGCFEAVRLWYRVYNNWDRNE